MNAGIKSAININFVIKEHRVWELVSIADYGKEISSKQTVKYSARGKENK